MRVGCAFHVAVAPGSGSARADKVVARYVAADAWQVCSVAGSKGERRYAWAWIATTNPRHYLLIRRHLATGELAFHYCYVPEGRPVTLMTLVRVACLRWPVEEGFEFGKDHFGLDHSQVRLYTALSRHIVLTLAALAVCAVTAGENPHTRRDPAHHTRGPATGGSRADRVDRGRGQRLFMLITRQVLPEAHHLRWIWWRRRHQARARWFHHRARLRRHILTA